MTSPTADVLGAAASIVSLLALAAWLTVLTIYLTRSVRHALSRAPAVAYVPLPVRTLLTVAAVNLTAYIVLIPTIPAGPGWRVYYVLAAVFWTLMITLLVVFGAQHRRRMIAMGSRVDRYHYLLAVEERRNRDRSNRAAELLNRWGAV